MVYSDFLIKKNVFSRGQFQVDTIKIYIDKFKVGGCVYQEVFKKQLLIILIIKVIMSSNDCFSRIGL